jgi:hypothetical protein
MARERCSSNAIEAQVKHMKPVYLLPLITAVLFPGTASADIVWPWFKAEPIRFELVDEARVRIADAVAYFHHGETVIRGDATLKTRGRTAFFTGAILATAELPDGRTAVLIPSRVHMRARPKVYDRSGYFTIHAGYRLPPGTIVRLTYRQSSPAP